MCCFFTAIPTFTRSLVVHRFFVRPPHWALNSRVSDCFFFPLFSVPSPLFSLEISRASFPPTVATTDPVKEIQNPVKEIDSSGSFRVWKLSGYVFSAETCYVVYGFHVRVQMSVRLFLHLAFVLLNIVRWGCVRLSFHPFENC